MALGLILKFLTSKLGLGLIGGVVLLAVVGGHFAHDRHVESDRAKWRHAAETWQSTSAQWKASSAAYKAAVGRSEGLRAQEYGDAKKALSEAQSDCFKRVQAARRSGAAIARIVGAEPVRDGAGCPLPKLVDALELKEALQP